MSGKKLRSNKVQIEILVDYMSTHNMLATGEFSGPLGSHKNEAEWQKIKDLLKEHGPDKTIGQWKQTWKDLKKNARAENAMMIRAHTATGNVVHVPSISEVSKKVLDTIGYASSSGIGPGESQIGLSNNDIEILVEDHPGQTFFPPPEFADENAPPLLDPIPLPVHASSSSTSAHVLCMPSTSQNTPRALPSSRKRVHDIFSELQVENNDVLKDIRSLLKKRNSLLREQNRTAKRKRSTRTFPFSFYYHVGK